MTILPAADLHPAAETGIAIVGAGACGLVAALMAREAGAEVLVVERDAVPQGSTAMSSGMIMACGTALQRAAGIADSVALMAADIQRKNRGGADPAMVEAVCRESGPAVEWLAGRHGVPLTLVEGFLYPGHSVPRMHAPPRRRASTSSPAPASTRFMPRATVASAACATGGPTAAPRPLAARR